MQNNFEIEKLINRDRYQVFLVTSPCSIPLSIFSHSWFVVNQRGRISRWELYVLNRQQQNWGKIHKDFLPPFCGLSKLPYPLLPKYCFKPILSGIVEGGDNSVAEQMGKFIIDTPKTYPFKNNSNLLGPNSNTFIQWVLKSFPDSGIELPRNALGKNLANKIPADHPNQHIS